MDTEIVKSLAAFADTLDYTEFFIARAYPAPPAVDLMKVDLEGLSLADIRKQLSAEELWQAANHFLKQRQFDLADTYYAEVIKKYKATKNEAVSKVFALRGLIRLCRGEYAKASTHLSKALLLEPSLEEARLWLAYIRLKEKKNRSVSHQLNLIKKNSKRKNILSATYLIQALYSLSLSKFDEVEESLKIVLEQQDEYVVRLLLAYLGFLKGKQCFYSDNFKESIKCWVEYAQISDDAWRGVSDITLFFNSLNRSNEYKKMLTSIRRQLLNKNNKELFYWYVCYYVSGLSLIPEFYESLDRLEETVLGWKKKKDSSVTYPYAHYRYALSLLYSGNPEMAYEEFLSVREKIPASKQGYFKIDSLIEFSSEIRETENGFDSATVVV